MAKPTEEQKTLASELAAAPEGGGAEASEAKEIEPVSLATMLGQGTTFNIGGVGYELAPFPLSKLPAAGRFVALCPNVLVLHAWASKDETEFDAKRTADLMRRLNKKEAEDEGYLTDEAAAYAVATAASTLSPEETEAMLELTALALSRKHPDIKPDTLDEHMTVPLFLQMTAAMFRLNPNFADRF